MSSAADSATPRLWEAVRGGDRPAHLYVLGATHWGLPVEYDDYFTHTVLPAFDQATTLHFEGAGNREPEPYPVCEASVLDSEGRQIVEQLREVAYALELNVTAELHRRGLAAGVDDGMDELVRTSMAKFHRDHFDEFQLLENYNSNLLMWNNFSKENEPDGGAPRLPAAAAESATQLRPAVANYLAARKPAVIVRDLDSRHGARRAYCSAGKHRIAMLQSIFAQQHSDTVSVGQQVPRWTADFIKVLHQQPLAPDASMMQLAPIDRQIVCQRTAEWLAEVEAYAPGGIDFLVVGARHLHNLDNRYAHCAGLLEGLAAAGFVVRAVTGAPAERAQESTAARSPADASK